MITNEIPINVRDEADICRIAKSGEQLMISMMNDFAFQTVFRNKKVLMGILSAMLHIPLDKIVSIELQDPVAHGEFPKDKKGILDIRLRLNNNEKINIEMQVLPFPFWEERTLFYLSKMYVEGFQEGMDYGSLETCIHIGILKHKLFESNGFYSQIGLRDIKTGRIYSDKLGIHVLQLNQLEQATDEQKKSELYLWARMISADDWEVLRMLAKQNEYIGEAVKEMEKINSDPDKRYKYLYHEMKERDEITIRNYYMNLGRDEGRTEGESQEKARYSRLIIALSEAGRMEQIVKAASDLEYLEELYRQYGI